MASHDEYDFDDFLRTSRIGFRLYKNNFGSPQNVSPAYRTCGERLLVLSACLRLLHEQGTAEDGIFITNVQAQVKRYVARIGDFRTTIEELGSLIRENTDSERQPWEAIVGEDLDELEKLSSSMRKHTRAIQTILVMDRTLDSQRALEILGQGMMSPRAVELPAQIPEQMANLVISDDMGRYRHSPAPNRDRNDELVSPVSPQPHVLNIPNQKHLQSVWTSEGKFAHMAGPLHMNSMGSRAQNHDFYNIHRTNSMSNSSDTGRSQSGSSSRNTSTQTLDSPNNSSPAQSPSTYFISHTGNNGYFREKDKVRYDEMAQISGMRIQPALSTRSADSPTNLSADFAPHSPSNGAIYQPRGIPELGGSMRIPRRPVSSTSSGQGSSVGGNTSTGGPNQSNPHILQQNPIFENAALQSSRDMSRQRPRELSVSTSSGIAPDTVAGRHNNYGAPYYPDDVSNGPAPRPMHSELPNTNVNVRRGSDSTAILDMRHRGSDAEASIRSRQHLDISDQYIRAGSRSNSFSTEPYMDAPFSPDAIALSLSNPIHRAESISSKDSKGEEGARPGETLIFQCKLQSATLVDGPYDPSEVRIFRNNQTDVIRFVTTIYETQTNPMSHSQHFRPRELELVPDYGYDPLARPIIWLREVDDINKLKRPLEIMPDREIPVLPAFRFAGVPDMLDFQSAVLGEVCYLDIETVRFVRLKGAAKETRRIDNTRVQLWHPAQGNSRPMDDSASFVTVGTTRTHANPEMMRLKWSRMVIYLGRSNDFVTVFVTDDISIRESRRGNTLVFEPTRYTGMALFKSRDGIKAKVVGGGSRKGGLRLDMKGIQPDDEENFPMFKTFEIEFEDAESKIRFLSTWEQLIQERRRMRSVIDRRKRLAEERMMIAGGGGN